MDDVDAGFFAIALSDSDEATTEATKPAPAGAGSSSRADKLAQSEEAFRQVKASYRPKIQNGEVSLVPRPHSPGLGMRLRSLTGSAVAKKLWRHVELPLGPGASKPALLEAVHAVEELYFYRRYDEAVAFVRRVLAGAEEAGGMQGDVKELLGLYERKCLEKLETSGTS